jgi:outer membrane protein OmpA-like peptidoglycan-associated protein
MKCSIPITLVIGALLSGGCATKKFVNNSIAPGNGRLDQVAQQVDQQGQTLDQTRQQQQKDETQLSALDERVAPLDGKAGQALQSANEANSKIDQNGRHNAQSFNDLNTQISNLNNYKTVGTATVLFKTGSAKLSPDAQQQLDQMAANPKSYQSYLITIEGFTDNRGAAQSNMGLSQRRADAVVAYLVRKGVPLWRIHMIGLGEANPGERESREAMAEARRCTITVLATGAGAAPAATSASSSAATGDTASVAASDDSTQTAQGNSSGNGGNLQQSK